MTAGIAIILLLLNIILMPVFYFKLKGRFSGKAEIREIKQEAGKLMGDIAFQTEQAVTILEDKLNEINAAITELDKHILIAKKETERRQTSEQTLQNIKYNNTGNNASKKNILAPEDTSAKHNIKNNTAEKPPLTEMLPAQTSEPIKIYTKQMLSSPNGANLQNTAGYYSEQIIEMARKGLSADLISEKVPIPIGEIELIISMNT